MTRLLALAGSCLLTIGMLAACAGNPGTPDGPGSPSAGQGVVAPGQLVGTWVVDTTFESPNQPYLTIIADGTWRGSDGCNGVQGTWEVRPDGRLHVTAGPSTLRFCDGKPLPRLFSEAATASVSGDTLTLKDDTGSVTATLISGREERGTLN